MKIATWNVNSIRARLDRATAFLERHDPDVLCLQETKVVEDSFPSEVFLERGYQSAVLGQKTYNGVAILAKTAIDDVVQGLSDGGDDSQARLIAGTIQDVRCVCVYVPNGKAVGTEAYAFKLEWLARLRSFLDKRADPQDALVVLGDFNVAPADADVHDPDAWRDECLCSQPERDALTHLSAWGLRDAFRELNPDSTAFSWWDYRRLGFPKNRGLRIDHMWLTEPLLQRCRGTGLLNEAMPALRVFDQLGGQHFESHLPIELDVERTVDDAHAPAPELAQHLVMRKRAPNH